MKVYLYCRNSCEHQTLSVQAQLDQLRAYAASNDYEVAGVFVDEAMSGATSLDDRLNLQAALASLSKGDGLLCLNQSRLARDTSIYFAVVAQVAKRKARLLFANGSEHSNDPMAKMISGMMALIAELERATIKRRQKAAYAVMRKKGCALGNLKLNKHRYGYSVVDGMLVPNEREQEILSVLVERRKNKIKYKDIITEFNARGFLTRDNTSFSQPNLSRLMKNYKDSQK